MSITGRVPLPRKAAALVRQLGTRHDTSTVVFNSFGGRFSDNPRGVYDKLVARGTGQRHVWVADADVPLPPGTGRVTPGTAGYAAAVGQARFVVSNARMPLYVKKRGVSYLQTWHGTPLKRIGYDNPRYGHDRDGIRRAARDYRRWDFLVSQNAFSSEIFRRAFRFDGQILETGYPRNDVLSSPRAGELRAGVRAALGIADDATVVLYAPTFRDDVEDAAAPHPGPALDLGRLESIVGPDVHVVTRLHHRDSARLAHRPSPFWTDASRHPDIRELYLASDALITDYSSVMFDYAVTGKPIVYFTYDLERYRDQIRGFYFDLEQQAPGPLCATTDEVGERLAALDAVQAAHADGYQRFRDTYCYLDDGKAAARIVDRVFGAR